MLTPFTEDNHLDFAALEALIDWYVKNQIDGLFAVCQSSEMFYLTLEERVQLAAFVKKTAAGRVPVIASGHVSDSFDDQVRELNQVAETGVDAVVLITNRLAGQTESDDTWLRNLEKLLKKIPENVPLGFYECPYPYKRILSPETLAWCAKTGRFAFLKDTCCDTDTIRQKLAAVKGTGLKIFNANTATLLETLRLGVSGYSGVMANFHPSLYVWLLRNWKEKPREAERLVNFLSMAALIERQLYPVNAKQYVQLEGVKLGIRARSNDYLKFTPTFKLEVSQLHGISKEYEETFSIF